MNRNVCRCLAIPRPVLFRPSPTHFAPPVSTITHCLYLILPSLCYPAPHTGILRGWEGCAVLGRGSVGGHSIRAMHIYKNNQNKTIHTHTAWHSPWTICLSKSSPWEPENKLIFSPYFLGYSTFFGKQSNFKDTGRLESWEGEKQRKSRGVFDRGGEQRKPRTRGEMGGTTGIISPTRRFACFLHQILFLSCLGSSVEGVGDLYFKNLRTWKPSSPTWAFNLPWIQKTEKKKSKDLEKQSQIISCSLIHSDPHLLKLHWWLCSDYFTYQMKRQVF